VPSSPHFDQVPYLSIPDRLADPGDLQKTLGEVVQGHVLFPFRTRQFGNLSKGKAIAQGAAAETLSHFRKGERPGREHERRAHSELVVGSRVEDVGT
jgi:hypothetical protein